MTQIDRIAADKDKISVGISMDPVHPRSIIKQNKNLIEE